MFKKYLFILITFAAFCAWGIAPNWSDANARSLNQSIPIADTDPADAPTNPAAAIPAEGPNGVAGPATSDPNISLNIRPFSPTFVRGNIFKFIARAINRGADNLRNVVVRFIVPKFTFFVIPGVQSAEVGEFTCQNEGEAGDICAYEVGDVASGTEKEFEIPLTVSEDFPDNGVESLSLDARVDGQNDPAGIFNTNRGSGTAVDEVLDPNDESIPEASEDVQLSPQDAENAEPATVDPNSGTVSVPLGFDNTSEQPLENVVLTAQLPEGATLPADSPWTCNDSGTCVQNVGTIAAGDSVSAPFVFIGNNINVGDPVSVPTRLDAQQTAADGTVTPINLRGTVEVDVTSQTPTGSEVIDEPMLDQKMFLPLIQTN